MDEDDDADERLEGQTLDELLNRDFLLLREDAIGEALRLGELFSNEVHLGMSQAREVLRENDLRIMDLIL